MNVHAFHTFSLGLINVHKAIHYKTVVTPGELLLNDTAYFKPKHVIKVQNTSSKLQTYKISHVPAGTAKTLANNEAIPAPVPLSKDYAKVTFSASTLTVAPGSIGSFIATVTPPPGLDPATFPVYTGFVKVTSADEELSVSYLGVAATMKNMKILDTSSYCKCLPGPVG